MSIISAKYAGKCRECKGAIVVGQAVQYTRGVKGVMCLTCDQKGAPATSAPYGGPSGPTAPGTGTELPADVGEGRHTVRVWQSFGDYVQSARETKPVAGEGCWYSPKAKFYGTNSWDEAMAIADRGWDAVRPQVDAIVDNIAEKVAPVLTPAFEMYFDVSGGAVDIGRYVTGEPECMIETRLVPIAKPGRVITILVSGGVLRDASTDDIIARGCAIVALVDSLEKMQHQTEIWLEASCASGHNQTPATANVLTHLVKLKAAGEALDIDMLMFAIANPARHRRLTFAVRRNEENMGARFGVPHEATTALTCKDRVGATLCLESLSYGGTTITGEKWVAERLSEFGLLREEG